MSQEKIDKMTQMLVKRGFPRFEASTIAKQVVRNLIAYSLIQDQREAYFSNILRNNKKS